jgi:2,3-bisphosphoglycerate-independent phosphoglycerate mutase
VKKKTILLVICDGWGVRKEREGNAIALASTPTYDRMLKDFPATTLVSFGENVGLPDNQMGNSEVGHLNLGAGRTVPQDILRIDRAIRDGSFYEQPELVAAARIASGTGRCLHLLGLLSDGGVHSHERHLWALLELARRAGARRTFVHAFLDGRDTPPRSALTYVERLEEKIRRTGVGKIATLSGRYYAMDRDRRWDRIEKAWKALVEGQGHRAGGARAAVEAAYGRGQSDEFVAPTVIEHAGRPTAVIEEGDAAVFFDFRADRARQLTQALTDPDFDGFARGRWPQIHMVTMTQYKKEFPLPVAFPPLVMKQILADVLADYGKTNLRIAETEKYAHVTYFFNGGVEKPYPGEERILIPSPKVATYDLEPAMSAVEMTERAAREIATGRFDLVVLNFANADMVGHTGKLAPTIAAVETLDSCFATLLEATRAAGGVLLLTADHGNAEQMIDPETGQPHTAHTSNPVPFILGSPSFRGPLRSGGALRDVAPTILGLMNLPTPELMEGRDLRRVALSEGPSAADLERTDSLS